MSEVLNPQDLFFSHKPAGVSTHRPAPDRLGFVEYLENKNQKKFFVCHRLDKATSGALLFAKSETAAARVGDLFAQQKVRKEYLLVSDQQSEHEEFWYCEEGTEGAIFTQRPRQLGGNNKGIVTEFKRLSNQGRFYLYKAIPYSGKTHQIRKHAVQCKIPILGDSLYGGSPFPRLMLHSEKLSFSSLGENFSFSAKPSRLFKNLSLCEDPQLSQWITSFERRETLFAKELENHQALRLFHSETGDLRGDFASDRWILGWWKKDKPTDEEQTKIFALCDYLNAPQWEFQWRPGAQEPDSNEILLRSSEALSPQWTFFENQVAFQGRMGQGQNFGLFLDQRQRREWVRENARDKSLLNLFSFTCGFSLYAALGGAKHVVSVDTSQPYLDWGKENFALNHLSPQDFEFRKMDSLSYLDYARKNDLAFDLIVCDPPSFSRHKKSKKVFRIEKDYPSLIRACSEVLSPGGTLLFSTNFEKWEAPVWDEKIRALAEELGFVEVSASFSQWDHEWQNKDANLKAFFLRKA